MDSPDQSPLILNLPEAKKEAIASITENDKKAFDKWSADLINQGKLNLPKAALRYMVIPPRILEAAEDPLKVGLDIVESSVNGVWALVVEHKPVPLTNGISRSAYLKESEQFLKEERVIRGNPRRLLAPEVKAPALPSDVDPYHVNTTYLKSIVAGIFGLNDYFLNNINLKVEETKPQILHVADYRIRDSLQRKGIGTSFYTRLRECARKLGFRFITGQNSENNNIVYFTQKLGRSTLDEVRPEKRAEFADLTPSLARLYSIDFLYPEDKAVYLNP